MREIKILFVVSVSSANAENYTDGELQFRLIQAISRASMPCDDIKIAKLAKTSRSGGGDSVSDYYASQHCTKKMLIVNYYNIVNEHSAVNIYTIS